MEVCRFKEDSLPSSSEGEGNLQLRNMGDLGENSV